MSRTFFKLGAQAQISPIKPLIAPQAQGDSDTLQPTGFPNGPMSLGSGVTAGGPGGVDSALQQQAMGQALDEQGKQVQDAAKELDASNQKLQAAQAELDSTKMQMQGMQQMHDMEKQQLGAQIEAASQKGEIEAQQAKAEADNVKEQAKAQMEAAKMQQKMHAEASKMQQKIQLEAHKAQQDLQAAQQPEGVSPALQEQADRALKHVHRVGQGSLKMAVTLGGSSAMGTGTRTGQQTAAPAQPAVTGTATQPVSAAPATAPAPAKAIPGQVPAATRQKGDNIQRMLGSANVPQELGGRVAQSVWEGWSPYQRRMELSESIGTPEQKAWAQQSRANTTAYNAQTQANNETFGGRANMAADTGKMDLFNANGAQVSPLGHWFRNTGNKLVNAVTGAGSFVSHVAANDDVKMRQKQMARDFGVDPGTGPEWMEGVSDRMAKSFIGGRRLGQQVGFAGKNIGNWWKYMTSSPDQGRAIKAQMDNEWNGINEQANQANRNIDVDWNRRTAYHNALKNEGINYNTGWNNVGQVGGFAVNNALNYASLGLLGGARAGGTQGLRALAKTSMPVAGQWLANGMTPDAGRVQWNSQYKHYNPYTDDPNNIQYLPGAAPRNYVNPDTNNFGVFGNQAPAGYFGYKQASFRMMAKRAVTAGAQNQQANPGPGSGFMLNRLGYASGHPSSPYQFAGTQNAREYGSMGKNLFMNLGLPLASFGGSILNNFGIPVPSIYPTVGQNFTNPNAGIRTGFGSTLTPVDQLRSMGLNPNGLPAYQ